MRSTKTGINVTHLGMATNRVWKDAESGERKQDVEYHELVAWRGMGETAAKYLRKGDKLFVEGRLRISSYTDKQGVERSKPEVIMENMIMLSGGRKKVNAEKMKVLLAQKNNQLPEEVAVQDIGAFS